MTHDSPDTHRIRLRAPWSVEHDASTDRVILRRRFGLPTGLRPTDTVTLVVDGATAPGRVWLNEQELGPCPARACTSFAITPWLRPRNEVRIELVVHAAENRSERDLTFEDCITAVGLEIK